MPVLPIVSLDASPLRRPCEAVGAVDAVLRQLVADMIETLQAVGRTALAAPQVGVPLRLFVLAPGGGATRVCLNPQVVTRSEAQVISVEPSLSGNGAEVYVARPDWVILRWQDLDGVLCTELFSGAEAVSAQRKLDILDGRLDADLPDCAPAPKPDSPTQESPRKETP